MELDLESKLVSPVGPLDEYGRSQTVWDIIEKQARVDPRRAAVIDGELEVSYARLIERANTVAGALVARGVKAGSLVGVCMGRTWELIAALLGVLRAGCAYVPLDPAYPRDHLRYMLEHAHVACIVVDDEDRAELSKEVAQQLKLGELTEKIMKGVARPSATDLAYVIYTSGSTGRPKGVAVEHRSVVAMIQSMRQLLNDEELAGVAAVTSVCFDISVMEIFGTLSLGGTMVMAENVLELGALPSADRVKTCISPPSVIQAALVADRLPKRLRCLVLGAEVLKRSLVNKLYAIYPRLRLINAYGPTEATVYTTATEISAEVERITIGKPVPSARTYILNDAMRAVPTGESGELHLGGDQLARGYLYDQALTEQRFIEVEPGSPIPEGRLYKTGDLCRWTEHGEIEFLGRVDQQVKLRGFRIELEDLESAMESMTGVDEAAAAVVDAERSMLVGYLVSRDDTVTGEALQAYLAELLPEYMLPQVIVSLDALPRLPNGKLDRKQLSRAGMCGPRRGSSTTDTGHLTRLSKTEQHALLLPTVRGEIASLIRTRVEDVPFDRSLQELGVDSLSAVELGARLATMTGRKLPASIVIGQLSLVDLVEHILDSLGEPDQPQTNNLTATNTLASFQAQIQGCHPPFFAANAPAWSATDKGVLVQQLKRLCPPGQDPYGKLVRTGSGHRGMIADSKTNEERESIIWTTNLYLGLNRDPEVIKEAGRALERFGSGMGTSAAASGVTDLHLDFEREFAECVGKPAACLFPTGYTANLGTIAGVLGENDVVVMDQLCHASIVDGARVSGAKIRTFQHNCVSDLEAVLKTEASPYRTILVVLEAVYSMGEGAAPIEKIIRVAKQYNALILVDEAHSFGFYGSHGGGLCMERGVTGQVDFIMTTLSKAMGSIGGVIAGGEEHIALLKSSSRAYIFQASTSPADMAAALTALRRLRTDTALRDRLWETTRYMRTRFTDAGYDLGTGDGPIVTPHFADKDKLFAIVERLNKRGVHMTPVTYPIVEKGRGRLRLICSASHTKEEVDRTLETLIEVEHEVNREFDCEVDARNQMQAGPNTDVVRNKMLEWADAFSTYVKDSRPSPVVSVVLANGEEPIRVTINESSESLDGDLPRCSLLLSDNQIASSLCSSDVQGLLHGVVKGTCVLEGQVEAFIWFIARMTAWCGET